MPHDREGGSAIRPLITLVAVIAAWWLAPGALRRVARAGIFEFQAPLFIAESRLRDLRKYWELSSFSNDELIAAGRDLARSNADLSLRLAAVSGAAKENAGLAAILDLPPAAEFRQVVARVANRDINRWWSRVILAKGARDGVREGCGVVDGSGVVGVVVSAHRDTCEVMLLSDPEFRMSAHVDGCEAYAIYAGASSSSKGLPHGAVSNLPADFKNTGAAPLRLVSSDVGGKFMFGLTIGVLERDPEQTPDGLFSSAPVLVRRDLATLSEAAILVPVDPDAIGGGSGP